MDIYKYAEEIDWNADYMDPATGYIYKIQEAGRMKKFGFDPDPKIRVTDYSGNTIGYARKS